MTSLVTASLHVEGTLFGLPCGTMHICTWMLVDSIIHVLLKICFTVVCSGGARV